MTQHRPAQRGHGRRRAALAAVLALVVGIAGVVVVGKNGSTGPSRAAVTSPSPPSLLSTTGGPTTGPQQLGAPVPGAVQGVAEPAGLQLSAGRGQQTATPVAVVDGHRLSSARVAEIIKRLPVWNPDDVAARQFRWPTQTIVAPRAGTVAMMAFPPSDAGNNGQPKPSAVTPLHVLRVQPQGPVSIAPFVSITFDQPMVPVTTVSQLAAARVPVVISPRLSGRWQWIGTSTLRFAADSAEVDRLPMATEFTVTVPAGTRAADGATLATAASSTFRTPPPTVEHFEPTGTSMKLEPIFVAVFDQRVNPVQVLGAVTVTAGSTPSPVRIATAADVAADASVTQLVSRAPAGRVVTFRPTHPLPADQAVTVGFGAGMPSAEGPLRTAAATTFTGHTYSALQLGQFTCGNGGDCQPSSPLVLTFDNTLDEKSFDPKAIHIAPEIPGGATVSASQQVILVQGATQADTTYTVTVPTTVKDVFGQQLGTPAVATFHLGQATRRLDPFPNVVTTLDPMAGQPSLTVNTVNRTEFRERVLAVSPVDWPAYQHMYLQAQQNPVDKPVDVPNWPVLVDRVVKVTGPKNRLVSTHLDLSNAISGPHPTSQAVVLIEPTDRESFSDNDSWQNRATATWVQSTDLGVDALNDATQLRIWVTDLRDGAPRAGVTVGMLGNDGRVDPARAVITDASGLASMPLTAGGAGALQATIGTQAALLPSDMYQSGWMSTPTVDRLLWFVDDDRQTYRPGETVSVKGWVRRQGSGVQAALTAVSSPGTVSYTARDAYDNDIGHGTAPVSALGGFDLKVVIPAGANLGSASIELAAAGVSGVDSNTYQHPFEIADFRTPDFQVDTHADSSTPAVLGNDVTVAADATYYAGGPLGSAPVDWQVRTAAATYAPPGWSEYTFGIWTPWWQQGDGGQGRFGSAGAGPAVSQAPCCGNSPVDAQTVDKFSGTTDAGGGDYLKIKVGNLGAKFAGLPVTVTAQATVTDVNRQAIAGITDLLVHPADFYVGLAGNDTFVTQGQDLVVQGIATGVDGAVAPGRTIQMRAAKLTSSVVNGVSVDTESQVQKCQVISGSGPVTCTFRPTAAGTYKITATIADDTGRVSRSELTRWVAGPDGSVDSSVQRQALTLVPDRKQYQPGESARLLVQSPIRAGSGLLTLQHNGIVSTSTFAVVNGSAVVPVPITDAEIPGITASVEVVGTAPRAGPDTGVAGTPRPAYATGEIGLSVSTQSRTLKVTATPRQRTVAPGSSTALDITVTDQSGKPLARSEFEVVVADEAVLALGGYRLPDPIEAFYPDLPDQLTAFYGRSTVMLADVPPPGQGGAPSGVPMSGSAASSAAGSALAAGGTARATYGHAANAATSATAGAVRSPADATGAIKARQNFDPLALFVPSATTNASGHATIEVPLPDSVTRYKVLVVAVAGNSQFGSAESSITAALPLTVRPSAPKFLNFGDSLAVPVLVRNLTDAPLTTDVVFQSANLVITGPAGKQVSVPAHGRIEVTFAVKAVTAGTAKFRVAAVSGTAADAATVDLPVYTPTTTESVATYGVLVGGQAVVQPVTAPTGVVEAFGGLQITTSSTALQQLSDAVGHLAADNDGSSDAMAGQIIAIASVADVLAAFAAPGLPSAATLNALVLADVGTLTGLQNDDGGFPYWQRGDPSDAFNSIQATQALLVAGSNGFKVGTDTVSRAQDYLSHISSHYPAGATQATRDSLSAYALNVLLRAGHRNAAAAEALVRQRGAGLPLDAVAWLLPVVADTTVVAALERRLDNAAVDDAGSVTFTNGSSDDAWLTLQSDRRTDGLVLDALIAVRPESDLIPRIVAGLMGGQQSGRWENLQENTFIVLAMRHYYDAFEKSNPDLVAQLWLGDRSAGQHAFRGHTTDSATVLIPTGQLIGARSSDVTIRDQGTGRLYYRIGLQTAPSSFKLTPLDSGFVVSRSYQAVDDPHDVTLDAAGNWHVKAGARVRVQLELVSRSAQNHVALIDPLPAGFEILNPELATTPKDVAPTAVPSAGAAVPQYWYTTWYDHQNLRDDRAEAFASQLQGGVYQYSYLARATTNGTFNAPPVRAEEVYAPETFGRGGSDLVVIGS